MITPGADGNNNLLSCYLRISGFIAFNFLSENKPKLVLRLCGLLN